MQTVLKPVVAITRDATAVALFGEVTQINKSQTAKLTDLAIALAAQVTTLDLPVSSKVALIEATYAGEMTILAADRNVVAQLRALLWAKIAKDTIVEVSPPSKDGKQSAVFKPAGELSPKQAKVHLAEVKRIVRETEETPEAKKEREAKEAKAKMDAQVTANAQATTIAAAKSVEAFAYVLSESQRPHLIQELAKQGLCLAKIKTAPTK